MMTVQFWPFETRKFGPDLLLNYTVSPSTKIALIDLITFSHFICWLVVVCFVYSRRAMHIRIINNKICHLSHKLINKFIYFGEKNRNARTNSYLFEEPKKCGIAIFLYKNIFSLIILWWKKKFLGAQHNNSIRHQISVRFVIDAMQT